MSARIDLKVILKSILIGIFLTVEGMTLQVLKGLFILRKEAPGIGFIIQAAFFYFITGFLFALGYFIVKGNVPGRNRAMKGLVYALLVFFGVAFGNLIGVVGLDFEGGKNLFTAYKIEAYAITITDFVNFLVTGIILGLVAEGKGAGHAERAPLGKGALIAAVSGFIGFPTAIFLLFRLLEIFFPPVFAVPSGAEGWFYAGFFIPLSITGAAIPLMYGVLRQSFHGSSARKGNAFFLYYYLCFWIINIAFGIPFGFSLWAVGYFLLSSAAPIYALAHISAWLLRERDHRSGAISRSSSAAGVPPV
jgi:hypothetical protein